MCAIDSKAFGQLFGYAVQVSIAHEWPAWERVLEVWDHWDYAMNSAIASLFRLTCRCTYENSYRIYLGSDYEHITLTKVRPGYKWCPYYQDLGTVELSTAGRQGCNSSSGILSNILSERRKLGCRKQARSYPGFHARWSQAHHSVSSRERFCKTVWWSSSRS